MIVENDPIAIGLTEEVNSNVLIESHDKHVVYRNSHVGIFFVLVESEPKMYLQADGDLSESCMNGWFETVEDAVHCIGKFEKQ